MSAAGRSSLNRPFWPFFFDVDFIDPPYSGHEDASLEQLKMHLSTDDVACFIFEPLIQGVNGMIMHSPSGLNQLLRLCRDHRVLLIADEVMTGFGRTGPLFACDQLLEPDMICLSKSLTGGALPLALTVCREQIYEGFLSQERSHAFLQGHTYTANPLGCAAALASLDLLLTPQCSKQRQQIESAHLSFKQQWGSHWKRCDVLGTILALEYFDSSDAKYFSRMRDLLSRHFLQSHIVIRPFGNTVHVMPPYCIEQEDLNAIYQSLLESLDCL
jgi:adenosylmethionine-8-amino-7-oxononanoate aminotransferase